MSISCINIDKKENEYSYFHSSIYYILEPAYFFAVIMKQVGVMFYNSLSKLVKFMHFKLF